MLGWIGPLKKTEHTYERVQCSVAGEGRRGHREVIHTHEFHTWIRRKTTHAPLPPAGQGGRRRPGARALGARCARMGRTVRAWHQRSTRRKNLVKPRHFISKDHEFSANSNDDVTNLTS